MSTSAAKCPDCGELAFLFPLHMAKGGPRLCISCSVEVRKKAKEKDEFFTTLMRGLPGSGDHAGPDELNLELLIAAIALTHPDVHPPERAEAAHRVTAELTALKDHTRPKAPPPKPVCDPSTVLPPARPVPRPPYPCEDCDGMNSFFYCDTCRGKYEETERARREPINAAARRRRALRRARRPPATCLSCRAEFRGKRRDATTCSPACRQKAYRRRVKVAGEALAGKE